MGDNPDEARERVNGGLVEVLGDAWRPELTDYERIHLNDAVGAGQLDACVADTDSFGIRVGFCKLYFGSAL